MIVLSDILDCRCIKLDMQATRKKDAIQELVDILVNAGKVTDAQGVVEELLAQEKLTSTGIGDGIAIPHKLLKHIPEAIMAFGRKKDGLNFDALDHQPVYLLFLILGPASKPLEHLQVLSKLSRLLHDQTLKNGLLEAQTCQEIWDILRRVESE